MYFQRYVQVAKPGLYMRVNRILKYLLLFTQERRALMESCPVCGRTMMPSSLKVHMGAAHSNKPSVSGTEEVQEEDIQNFVRGKRAAATKYVFNITRS